MKLVALPNASELMGRGRSTSLLQAHADNTTLAPKSPRIPGPIERDD